MSPPGIDRGTPGGTDVHTGMIIDFTGSDQTVKIDWYTTGDPTGSVPVVHAAAAPTLTGSSKYKLRKGTYYTLTANCPAGPKNKNMVRSVPLPSLRGAAVPFILRFPFYTHFLPFFRRLFALSGFLAPRRRKQRKHDEKRRKDCEKWPRNSGPNDRTHGKRTVAAL